MPLIKPVHERCRARILQLNKAFATPAMLNDAEQIRLLKNYLRNL